MNQSHVEKLKEELARKDDEIERLIRACTKKDAMIEYRDAIIEAKDGTIAAKDRVIMILRKRLGLPPL